MRSARTDRFAMVPRSDVPRSAFRSEHTHKTTFDAGFLVPIYVDEILPGDSCRVKVTAFTRMATPVFPVMDNLHLDLFFFYVPMRLVWSNFKRFMGEQATPSSPTSFLVPVTNPDQSNAGRGSQYDYFGIPTPGDQVPMPNTLQVNALPFRAYELIWNEWFRDQNQQAVTGTGILMDDGPDPPTRYTALKRRGKRHDYFTSALPWPQKETSLTSLDGIQWKGGAPVSGLGALNLTNSSGATNVFVTGGSQVNFAQSKIIDGTTATRTVHMKLDESGYPDVRVQINDMRLAFAAQRLMERDARGGTRYTEIVRSHFGVVSPDARLQRPEYLGGGRGTINVNPIVQQSETATTPLGTLGGVGTGVIRGGFSQSFTEHGYIIGIASVRADLTYQQGLARMWSRRTRFDFYWPAFAHLGEQAVLRKEIYATGVPANDNAVFGYAERWAEYRYKPNRISGYFRSRVSGTMDAWHLAQNFLSAPVLSDTFIREDPPMSRVLAGGATTAGQQFLFDSLFEVNMVRPIPAYSVPGLADHF